MLARLFHSATLKDLLALYGVQAANYLFLLLTLPYLARVLGPEAFGRLAIAQAYGMWVALLVEYGFNLSATRAVARMRGEKEGLRSLFGNVLLARLLLGFFALFLTVLLLPFLSSLLGAEGLLFAGLFWGVALDLSPLFLLQGLERLRPLALLEVGAKLFALLLLFPLVKGPEDAPKVLLLQGGASLLSGGGALLLGVCLVGLPRASLRGVWGGLVEGWPLFFFRLVVSLYTAGNAFLVGLFLPPNQVALWAGAERLAKALLGLVEPLNRAFFPRFAYLHKEDPERSFRLGKRVALAMGGFGLLGMVGVWAFAPLAVHLLLGPGYEGAVPLMRVLALLLPLVAFSNFLGGQWMLSRGLDRPFNAIILLAGVLNLAQALLLLPRFGVLGMAWGLVGVEGLVTASMVLYLWRRGLLPWMGVGA